MAWARDAHAHGIGERGHLVVHVHDADHEPHKHADHDRRYRVRQKLEARDVHHVDEDGADAHQRQREDYACPHTHTHTHIARHAATCHHTRVMRAFLLGHCGDSTSPSSCPLGRSLALPTATATHASGLTGRGAQGQ